MKKATAKKPQRSTKSGKSSIIRKTWQENFFDLGKWKTKPVSDEDLCEYGKKYIEWCRAKRKAIKGKIEPFYHEEWLDEEGIPLTTFNDWRKRNEFLEMCVQHGHLLIGVTLEKGMHVRDLAEKSISMMLHHYLERYRQSDQYHAILNPRDKEGLNKVVKIEISKIEDCPEVPVRINSEIKEVQQIA